MSPLLGKRRGFFVVSFCRMLQAILLCHLQLEQNSWENYPRIQLLLRSWAHLLPFLVVALLTNVISDLRVDGF